MIDQKLLITALVVGVIWGLMFYYVRKGLNKRNFEKGDPVEKRKDFYYDGLYGGLGAGIGIIIKDIVMRYVQ